MDNKHLASTPNFDDLVTKVDYNTEYNRALSDPLTDLYIEIEGIESEEELLYLNKLNSDPEISLPLYLNYQGAIKRIGMFELSLDKIIGLLEIYPYKLYLINKGVKSQIPLDTSEDLEKFIKL